MNSRLRRLIHDLKCHSIMCWWSSTLNAQPRCCPELSNAASTELNVMMSALSPSSVNQSKANCHWLPLAHAPQMISGNNYQCWFFLFEILNLMCRICHICSVRGSDTVKSRCWWMRCTSQVSVGEFHLGEFPAAKVNVAILHLETYGNRNHIVTNGKHHEKAHQLLQHSIQLSKMDRMILS